MNSLSKEQFFRQIIEILIFFLDKPLHNLKIELPAPPTPNLDKKMIKFIFIITVDRFSFVNYFSKINAWIFEQYFQFISVSNLYYFIYLT